MHMKSRQQWYVMKSQNIVKYTERLRNNPAYNNFENYLDI